MCCGKKGSRRKKSGNKSGLRKRIGKTTVGRNLEQSKKDAEHTPNQQ